MKGQMVEFFPNVQSLAIGLGLGLIFFAGLFWTVRKGAQSSQPAFWFLGSMLLRMAMVLAGFVFVARSGWLSVLVYFFGLMLARESVTWLTRLRTEQPAFTNGVHRAP
jgi:F1F0 ATPase subunit 2